MRTHLPVASLLLVIQAHTSVVFAQPEQVILNQVGHAYQDYNNCGPVIASIILGYYGHTVNQYQAAEELKDSSSDRQVSTPEVAAYLQRFGLETQIRYAGSPDVLRALLARNIPVVIQQRLKPGSNTAHFRVVYGYTPDGFLASDPLRGPKLHLNEAELLELWHYYNGEYLVAYPPERADAVREALGSAWNQHANWRRLREIEQANVQQRPGDAFSWWGLGKANYHLGQYQQAAEAFNRAVSAGLPTQYYWYRQDAFAAWNRVGQYNRTIEVARRALETYPSSSELKFYLNKAQQLSH